MKSVRFWSKQVRHLSALERLCLINAFDALSTWEVLRQEYHDFDLIKRILEMENRFTEYKTLESRIDRKRGCVTKHLRKKD